MGKWTMIERAAPGGATGREDQWRQAVPGEDEAAESARGIGDRLADLHRSTAAEPLPPALVELLCRLERAEG